MYPALVIIAYALLQLTSSVFAQDNTDNGTSGASIYMLETEGISQYLIGSNGRRLLINEDDKVPDLRRNIARLSLGTFLSMDLRFEHQNGVFDDYDTGFPYVNRIRQDSVDGDDELAVDRQPELQDSDDDNNNDELAVSNQIFSAGYMEEEVLRSLQDKEALAVAVPFRSVARMFELLKFGGISAQRLSQFADSLTLLECIDKTIDGVYLKSNWQDRTGVFRLDLCRFSGTQVRDDQRPLVDHTIFILYPEDNVAVHVIGRFHFDFLQ